jgi:hypothetical protein
MPDQVRHDEVREGGCRIEAGVTSGGHLTLGALEARGARNRGAAVVAEAADDALELAKPRSVARAGHRRALKAGPDEPAPLSLVVACEQ